MSETEYTIFSAVIFFIIINYTLIAIGVISFIWAIVRKVRERRRMRKERIAYEESVANGETFGAGFMKMRVEDYYKHSLMQPTDELEPFTQMGMKLDQLHKYSEN